MPGEPGNSRASSGGETRIMRGTYGPDQPYTEMAARALILWAKYERKWKRQFLHRTGVLWMASERDDVFEARIGRDAAGVRDQVSELTAAQMKKRWPQINFEGYRVGHLRAGVRISRCASKLSGGSRRIRGGWGQVSAGRSWSRRARRAHRSRRCLCPTVRDSKPTVSFLPAGHGWESCFLKLSDIGCMATKQDIFFFGTPPGDSRFSDEQLPVWADHRGRFRYGIPGRDRSGFKIADDTRGPEFDPSSGRAGRKSRNAERHPRIRRLSLPCPERCAADRNSRLPI